MKFETLNYYGSNEGKYEIRNPSSPNAFPNPQTLRKKRSIFSTEKELMRFSEVRKFLFLCALQINNFQILSFLVDVRTY